MKQSMLNRPMPLARRHIGLILPGCSLQRKAARPNIRRSRYTRANHQAVTATGTLNPVVNVQVGSQISGNIQKLYVDFNSNGESRTRWSRKSIRPFSRPR